MSCLYVPPLLTPHHRRESTTAYMSCLYVLLICPTSPDPSSPKRKHNQSLNPKLETEKPKPEARSPKGESGKALPRNKQHDQSLTLNRRRRPPEAGLFPPKHTASCRVHSCPWVCLDKTSQPKGFATRIFWDRSGRAQGSDATKAIPILTPHPSPLTPHPSPLTPHPKT
jgi:hypothetical protein